MNQQQLITPKEAAPLLKVSERTLKRWRKAGKGPKPHRLEGRAIRYRLADVEAWIGTAPRFTLKQVEELRATGLHLLYEARTSAMAQTVEELQEALQQPHQEPQDCPPWSLFRLLHGMDLTSPGRWEVVRAHLTARTVMHIAGKSLSPGVTGYSLAAHIGADLHALAFDGWEGLTAHALSLTGDSAHV